MKTLQLRVGTYKDRYAFFLLVLLIGIAVLAISYISANKYYCAPEAEFAGFLHASQHTSSYPPGVFLLVNWFQKITGLAVNHYLYKSIMLVLCIWAAYATARYVFGKSWLCFFAVFTMMLNPYFIWTCLISPDTASECFFLFLSFYILLRLNDHDSDTPPPIGFWCLLAVVLAMTAIMRSTNFVILLSLLGVFCIFCNKKIKKFFPWLLIAFCLYTALFCLYNYKRSGSFGLGTTFGINLFIGNHPLYLHGHPNYDIDLFFDKEALADTRRGIAGLTEAQQNHYYLKAGMDEILQDVPAFFYRCMAKSLWHWFNFEKIPRLVAPKTHLDRDGKTIHVGSIVILPSLLYVVYKLFYIPLFVSALFLLFQRKLSLHEAIFFVPYFALWPIVVLLFPDTRFKLCAEIMAVIPIMRSLQYIVSKQHGAKRETKIMETLTVNNNADNMQERPIGPEQ